MGIHREVYIRKSIPSALKISLHLLDFLGLVGLRKSLMHQGWISQYLLSFGGTRIHSSKHVLIKGGSGFVIGFQTVGGTMMPKLEECKHRYAHAIKNNHQQCHQSACFFILI